jgi:hypothetical protein
VRIDCALLCDAASVREGLLHVLGGGVTRANRAEFPGPLGMALAVRVMVHPTEMDRPHALEIRLQGEDGQLIAEVDVQFESVDPGDLAPGEESSLPLALALPQQVALPQEGRYSFEMLIDGIHQATVPFMAVLVQEDS